MTRDSARPKRTRKVATTVKSDGDDDEVGDGRNILYDFFGNIGNSRSRNRKKRVSCTSKQEDNRQQDKGRVGVVL